MLRRVPSPLFAFILITAVVIAMPPSPPARAQKGSSLESLSESFEQLSIRVTPSIVQIFTVGYSPSRGRSGTSIISKQRGTGTGVILDSDGYIVTNAHVVQGARNVRVMIPLTQKERDAQSSIVKSEGRVVGGHVIGVDPETDIAVVKVQEKGLPALDLGDSDTVHPGSIVLAFGNPFGLNNSVSMGIVSAVARQFVPEHPVVYIQTDATINPGNSGGPLVSADGTVVGINTMIFSQSGGSEGIGFAIPSNIVRNIFQQLRSTGRVRRGQIGVNAQTIDPILARGLELPKEAGVILGDVFPDGAADKAGLLVGDIVLSLDGKPMENGRQLEVNLYSKAIGKPVTLEILRGGKSQKTKVTVAERASNPDLFDHMVTPEKNLIERLGILGLELTPVLNQIIPGLRRQEGVLVAARSDEGPVWKDRFVAGDVIFSANGNRVRTIEQLESIADGIRPGDALVVQIQRGRKLQYLWFEME